MTSREFHDRLDDRTRRAGIPLPADLLPKLEAYYQLLVVWNEKINLTGLDLNELTPSALDRLLVEPLTAARRVKAGSSRMIDVGSGGGSPAIPLALAAGLKLLMVESKTRKSVFLREALRAVEMNDGEVATARFETLLSSRELHEAHDLLTIRAVRINADVCMSLQAFVRPGGQLFLFRRAGYSDFDETIVPPIRSSAIFPLVESTETKLIVFEKI